MPSKRRQGVNRGTGAYFGAVGGVTRNLIPGWEDLRNEVKGENLPDEHWESRGKADL